MLKPVSTAGTFTRAGELFQEPEDQETKFSFSAIVLAALGEVLSDGQVSV